MFSNKNSTVFLISALILMLALGLILGYLLGIYNKPEVIGSPETAYVDWKKTAEKKTKINTTASEAYIIASNEVKSWAQDAALTEINLASKKISAAGEASGWKIVFYSKSKNKLYDVFIKDAESRGGEERVLPDKKSPQTLKSEMIDSPALAKSFFATYPADTEIISLKMYYDFSAKKFIWTIFFPKGSHTVDAEI